MRTRAHEWRDGTGFLMPGPGAGDSGCDSVEDQATALVVVRDLGQDPEVVTASIPVLSDCAAAGAEASGWVRAARIPVAVMVRIGCLVMAACARLWAGKFDSQVMVASTVFLPGAARVLPDTSRSRLSGRGGDDQVPAPCRGRPRAGRAPGVGRGDRRSGRCAAAQARPRRTAAERSTRWGSPAGDCVFVGDSEVDTRAARAAGMGFVAVLSGHDDGGGVRKVSGEGGAGRGGGDCTGNVMSGLHFVW